MKAEIIFFPVGCGDMTLIKTSNGKRILIDCNIRDPESYPDVVAMLKEELETDSLGRHLVDLFVWSHPDEDHCRGIRSNFYLGDPNDYPSASKKIFIKEVWSSPLVFRRASRKDGFILSDDAKGLNAEVKRRIRTYKDTRFMGSGNRVTVLGLDEDGKTDDIMPITKELDEEIYTIDGFYQSDFKAKLYGPATQSDLDQEEKLSKNNSSVIMKYTLSAGNQSAEFLTGGDAEVMCWEHLTTRIKNVPSRSISELKYDILQVPHHCSWHSLSEVSWGKIKEDKLDPDENVSPDALEALKQAKDGAFIISSSSEIEDDDNDPPCYGAKEQYLKIASDKEGRFECVADSLNDDGENVPYRIEISSENGVKRGGATTFSGGLGGGAQVNRSGTDNYA